MGAALNRGRSLPVLLHSHSAANSFLDVVIDPKRNSDAEGTWTLRCEQLHSWTRRR